MDAICCLLFGEGMAAFSPRLKSKRRSEGPDIFKGVEERRGRTNQDLRNLSALVTCNLCTRRSSELEEASSEIGEASAFPDVSASVTCTLDFVEITGSLSKRRFQISKRHLLFQTCQRLSHAHSALQKLRAICRRFLMK
ncbi:hypothetical protein COP2_019386 [Malus domestica]